MTLSAYLRIFRERWRLMALVGILTVGLSVLVTVLTPRSYSATAQVFVSATVSGADVLEQAQAAAYIPVQVATLADIAHAPEILHRVETDLGLPRNSAEDSALRNKISASAPAQRSLVNITVTDSSPSTAAQIANSTASAFADVVQGYLTTSDSSKAPVKLIVTGPATAPSSPTAPKPVLNIALGIILGLLAGIALAIARDVLDRRIRDADSLEKVAGVPTMGVIVDDPKTERHPIATRAGSRNVRAENFRQLRANLQFANVDQHPRVIAITSSVPSEGKTMAAINLASTLAEAGFTVCLVDADLRRPSVAKALGLPSAVGLTTVLIHQIGTTDALQRAGENLYVLSSGPVPPNPSEVLASSYMRDVIRSLLDHVDYVVLDTAPLLPVADGAEVAALADGTLMVVRHGDTTDTQVKRALHNLRRVDATLLGAVLNRVPKKHDNGEYAYSEYHSYAVGKAEKDGPRPNSRHAHDLDSMQAPDKQSVS